MGGDLLITSNMESSESIIRERKRMVGGFTLYGGGV